MRALLSHTPAFPDEPHVKVKKSWGMGEGSYGVTLHWYAMLVDLVVEGFAQGDGVASVILGHRGLGVVRRKPEAQAVELCGVRDYVTASPQA